jgi:hypothetical protein
MSQLKVNALVSYSGNTVTLGTSGDTINVASGVTFNTASATINYPAGSISNAAISSTAAIQQSKISGNPTFRNAVINGDFSIAQRGTSFTSSANNDDVYTLDRWYILSDDNDVIDVTQETTTVPTNQLTAIALDVETANKKFGIAQIIEQQNCVGLIGNTVTLSFKAKVSSTTKLDNVKCAIIAWSGTANTVTSDIISAWGSEGTNPTLIANATYENTPANLSLTTSYATYSVSAAVDTSSTKNIIVFIWSDVTDTTAGDFLYITDVQLENGSAASPFEFLPVDVNLRRCFRYYQRDPSATETNIVALSGQFADTGGIWIGSFFYYGGVMRAVPTISYKDRASNAGKVTIMRTNDNTYTNNINLRPFYADTFRFEMNTYAEATGFSAVGQTGIAFLTDLNFSAEL